MRTSVLRQSAALGIDINVVEECLDTASTADYLFARAWRSGPASLTRTQRCRIAGVTGHIAESVAADRAGRWGPSPRAVRAGTLRRTSVSVNATSRERRGGVEFPRF